MMQNFRAEFNIPLSISSEIFNYCHFSCRISFNLFLNFQFSAKYSTFNTLSIFITAILILSIKLYASSRGEGDGAYRG